MSAPERTTIEAAYSLDPEIIRTIEALLRVLAIPHLKVEHPLPCVTVAEKLASLDRQRATIFDYVLTSDGAHHPEPSEKSLFFLIARTLTVKTPKGQQALFTSFVNSENKPFTTAQKKAFLVALGVKASNKEVHGLQLASESWENLHAIGAAPGVVGPWTLPTSAIPIVVSPPILPYHNPNLYPFVDFALTTRESILIPNFMDCCNLINKCARSLNRPEPIWLEEVESETIRVR